MGTIHNNGIRHFTVYLGLYLVALGEGGIKPCTSALGADQFDGADPVEKVTKASFFNWYYFSISIGSLLSGTVLVWVQDNVGWGVGFLIPTVLMVFGLVAFVAGRRVYRYKKLEGSPLKRFPRWSLQLSGTTIWGCLKTVLLCMRCLPQLDQIARFSIPLNSGTSARSKHIKLLLEVGIHEVFTCC